MRVGVVLGVILAVGAAIGGSYALGEDDWMLPAPFAWLMPGPLEGTWDGTSTYESTQNQRDPRYCSGAGTLLMRVARSDRVTLTVRRSISPDYRTRCTGSNDTGEYAAAIATDERGHPLDLTFTDDGGNQWRLHRTKATWLEGTVSPAGPATATSYFADDVFLTRHEGGSDDPHAGPRTLVVAALGGAGFAGGLLVGIVVSGLKRLGRR